LIACWGNSTHPPRVIVIGAGIGGLSAAIALSRAGLDVQVYERVAELASVGAGISLWKNALVALERLGVYQAIRALGVPGANAGLRTWDGSLLVDAGSTQLQDRFGEFVIVVHRAALQQVLLDATGPGCVHLGHACAAIDEDASGVTVRFANGETTRGDAVIGADGLHSVVRAHLHGDQRPSYRGYTAWRGVVPFDHERLRVGESWGPGRRFGQMPMAGGQVYWFATANVPEGERSPDGEKADLLRRFRGWHDPIEALIAATPDAAILRNDMYDRSPLGRWGRGRLTLLGDAAHPMTPNLGQGGCQAIEDAVVLGAAIASAAADRVPDALRAYEDQRVRRTANLINASRRIGVVGQLSNPLLVSLRNAAVKAVGGRMQASQIAALIEPVV
jgi:2-polyprenyl-6-methoxyphenol hydroxylase-like FAD-dependent oxidoreductase